MRNYVRFFGLLLVAGCLTALLPADARAQSEVVVQPGNLSGWTVAVSPPDSGASFDFVSGPGAPPLGSGSLGAEISNSGARVVLMRGSAPYSGQTVSGLTSLSITTYNDQAGGSSVADGWYVDLYIDSENNGIPDCRLHQAAPQPTGDTWATYDLLSGTWTGFNNLTDQPGCEGFSGTLSDFAAASPNALFLAFPDASEPVVQVSVGNSDADYVGYRGNLDSVTISHSALENQVWNFEQLYKVGGTVSGLSSGSDVELALNGSQLLVVDSPGAFEFPDGFLIDTDYEVTVETQPDMPQQICTVTNGSGTLVDDDADDVQVDCTTVAFTVGGTVSGLVGDQVVLQNNGGDDQVLVANGGFTFTAQDDGSSYNVTVATAPTDPSQSCSVSNATGTLSGADVNNVEVLCTTDQFTVGGTVSGLEGDQVVLQNNGADDQVMTADGGFAFTAQDDGSSYDVTVATAPEDPSQTCSVSNGAGTLAGADVTAVEVTCTTDQFTVGGVVSGLLGGQLVLQNNGGGDLAITSDGPFAFLPQNDATGFDVTVLTQPDGQFCSVNNGGGTLAGADFDGVMVDCGAIELSLGLSEIEFDDLFIGQSEQQSLTLLNPGSVDLIVESLAAPTLPFTVDDSDCSPLPLTLAPGESCTLLVSFSANQSGRFQDGLEIVSNAGSSPDSIALRGSVLEPLPVPVLTWPGIVILSLLTLVMAVRAGRPAF